MCKSYPDLAVQARIPELLQAQRADMDRQAVEDKARWANDDDDMDDDEEAKLVLNGGRRGGVTSGAMGSEGVPKGPSKNEEERDRILDTIAQNGFLRQLEEDIQDELVDAVAPVEVDMGTVVIAEGESAEEADKFYIIEEGTIETRQGPGGAFRELTAGDAFGELALLHGAAREANFVAKTPAKLWVLGRDAYRLTIMRATEARRSRYKEFLRQVTCLKAISDYDCLALADAAEEVEVAKGTLAYAQGDDDAHRLSVVMRGEASCFLTDAVGNEREVARLQPGDHFVEDPANPEETANVRAVGEGRRALVLLRVEADVFLRLAGSVLSVGGTSPFEGIAGAVELTSKPAPEISAAQRASWDD